MATDTLENTLRDPSKAVAPHVIRLTDKIVNSYLIGDANSESWIVVDAGMSPGHAKKIFTAAEETFGKGSKPAAIVLTHGHFDHVAALEKVLQHWNVPVFAHPLELPFLDGRSDYPPPDPTVGGGMMARMSPLFSRRGLNLGDRVQALPEDGSIPHLTTWRWIHTPGHTAGHISLFRDEDRTLIAGDAFVTLKAESAISNLTRKESVRRPPAYFTTDWEQARRSVETLAELRPEIAATGHGIPMHGELLRHQLDELAANFAALMPRDGRYVRHPAVTDARGVQFIPPAVPDPLPKVLGAVAAITATALIVRKVHHGRRKRLLKMT